MTNKHRELLSAYLDGEELTDAELADLLNDSEAMEEWSRITEIRAGIKGEISNGVDFDKLSSSVSATVALEPSLLKQTELQNSDAVNDENVVEKHTVRHFSGFWNKLGQIAVAASVAGICVVSAQMFGIGNSSNSNFAEESYVSGQGMAISPVTNTNQFSQNNVVTIPNTQSQVRDQAVNNSDAIQLKKLQEKKEKEVKTLDALLNDHELVMKTIGM